MACVVTVSIEGLLTIVLLLLQYGCMVVCMYISDCSSFSWSIYTQFTHRQFTHHQLMQGERICAVVCCSLHVAGTAAPGASSNVDLKIEHAKGDVLMK